MNLFGRKRKEPQRVLPPEWLIPTRDIREEYSGIRLVEPIKPKCTCNNNHNHVSGAIVAISGSYSSTSIYQEPYRNTDVNNRISCKYPHYKMDYIH